MDCTEHVWALSAMSTGTDGRITQTYECERCPAVREVGPDDVPPGSPDSPV